MRIMGYSEKKCDWLSKSQGPLYWLSQAIKKPLVIMPRTVSGFQCV